MRPHLACAVVLLCAGIARAQDAQQDIAERIVREQVDLRKRSVEKALGAPAAAFARLEDRADAPPPVRATDAAHVPARGRRAFPWAVVLFVAAALVAGLAMFAARRRDDGRR